MGRHGCPVLVLFSLCLLCGCGAASKKAHEAAETALYKPITYENAGTRGPLTVVLPGGVNSRSALFIKKYGGNNIRDFAEIELAKANFPLLENADNRPRYLEMALAANLGDALALHAFRKACAPTARCLVSFEVIKAEPVAWEAKGGSGEAAGALIELGFILANKGKESPLGKSLGTAISSLKHYEYKTTWDVALRYTVINALDGRQVCSDVLEERQVASMEVSEAVGVSNKETMSFTLDAVIQRLIQRSVGEIDRSHKARMNGLAEQDAGDEGRKAASADKDIAAAYAKKLEEFRKKTDGEAAVELVRSWVFALSTIDEEAALLCTSRAAWEKMKKKLAPFVAMQNAYPNWRSVATFEVAVASCELLEYSPERCTVKLTGNVRFGPKGQEKDYPQSEVKDLVKEDGSWKIAAVNDGKE